MATERGEKDARSGMASGMAIVAGSGFGGLGEILAGRIRFGDTVAFENIDGVGACTVAGHRGEVRLGVIPAAPAAPAGKQNGEIDGRPLALVLGRRHVYEGGPMGMAPLMRWLARRGVGEVVAVSAAGSVRGAYLPGELVVITDIIDLQNREHRRWRRPARAAAGPALFGFRPPNRVPPETAELTGPSAAVVERAAWEARPGLSGRLIGRLETAANRSGVALRRGTLACGAGPAYESRAEIRALQEIGADVATMSAAPETQYACELGMEIAVVAAITNPGTGIGTEPPDHGRVIETAESMCGPLGDVLVSLVEMA